MRGRCVLLLLTLACAVPPLPAQAAGNDRAGLSQPHPPLSRNEAIAAVTRDLGNTYWKEGGLVTVVPGILLANLLMDTGDQPLLAGLALRAFGTAILGAFFFLPGALIGAQFPKD